MRIEYSKAQNADDAFKKAQVLLTPEALARFKVEAKVDCDSVYKRIKADGKGFNLTAQFDETACTIDLDLSFMLKAFKSTILAKLEDQLKRVL